MRPTDVFVQDKLRLVPLSVSADRIAHVALRCAVLLAKLDASGMPVDRTRAGAVAEVYPAASLLGWGLRHRGYKQPRTPDVLAAVAGDLLAAAPWLDCGPHEETIRRSHDAFDAVIAALTARSASQGQTWPPGANGPGRSQDRGLDSHPELADRPSSSEIAAVGILRGPGRMPAERHERMSSALGAGHRSSATGPGQ